VATIESLVPSVSIIVPTYKEAENLPVLIPQVAAAMSSRSGGGWLWELIVVDDNSPDATKHVLDQLSARYPQMRYLIRTKERGLSSAVLAGLQMAVHQYVVVMDADLSHPAESAPSLVEPLLRDEADFVIGSRYVDGGKTEDWSRLRRLNSWGATMLAKPLVGTVKDPMAGFFSLRREMLKRADPMNPIGYKIGLELISKMKIAPGRVAEVPIIFRNRMHGESKLTLKEQFHYLEHLSRLYDYAFPKGSPRVKYLIAAGCGAVASFVTLGLLEREFMAPFFSLAAAMLAMIAVTLVFFIRYVRTQHGFIVMKHPYAEFMYISMAEFVCGWAFAISTHAPVYTQLAVGLVILLLVRYTLRKVFLHDLRGIRGTARESGKVRISLAGGARKPAASA
jgi:dolichol-phosphate mannosyltransferase